jgi:hypothetical protein
MGNTGPGGGHSPRRLNTDSYLACANCAMVHYSGPAQRELTQVPVTHLSSGWPHAREDPCLHVYAADPGVDPVWSVTVV